MKMTEALNLLQEKKKKELISDLHRTHPCIPNTPCALLF